jgi:hypothetical protein
VRNRDKGKNSGVNGRYERITVESDSNDEEERKEKMKNREGKE